MLKVPGPCERAGRSASRARRAVPPSIAPAHCATAPLRDARHCLVKIRKIPFPLPSSAKDERAHRQPRESLSLSRAWRVARGANARNLKRATARARSRTRSRARSLARALAIALAGDRGGRRGCALARATGRENLPFGPVPHPPLT